jgi:esterase/lipase
LKRWFEEETKDMAKERIQLLLAGVLVLQLLFPCCHSFVHQSNKNLQKSRFDLSTRRATATGEIDEIDSLEVVLFGIGDLRADDHEGLRKSLERASTLPTSRVLPLVVLDKEAIANLPGAVAHTEDMSSMISEAINDLQGTLERMNLNLHVQVGSDSTIEGLSKVLHPYLGTVDVRVHVCDHGLVDNTMRYTPSANLQKDDLPSGCTLVPWSCELRSAPWENIESVPDTYDGYTKKFNFEPTEPVATDAGPATMKLSVDEFTKCPTAQELSDLFQQTLALDPQNCQQERNSGLYSTHWGGLSASTVGESKVLETLRVFVDECGEDDEEFAKRYPFDCTRNKQSLEHAIMVWNLRGDGSKSTPETNNIIAGELLSRYLLAPLMLGTLSPRRLWYSVKKAPNPLFGSPVRTLIETREWHKLFASKCLLASKMARNEGMTYKFWRWHGFLCRYGEQIAAPGTSTLDKQGILLIHGFGASANQWQKTINAIAGACTSDPIDDSPLECLVPDLIGFGQSEKPPITYSGFTWEAYTSDFVKEIACKQNNWQSFVIGGNSIGGFVSMCAAANDATTNPDAISGCGAPGTGRCAGTILMNPAGVIQSKEDVETIESSVLDKSQLQSVAQMIATDGLAPCK